MTTINRILLPLYFLNIATFLHSAEFPSFSKLSLNDARDVILPDYKNDIKRQQKAVKFLRKEIKEKKKKINAKEEVELLQGSLQLTQQNLVWLKTKKIELEERILYLQIMEPKQ